MSDSAFRRWICDACGYIYDEAKGDPDSGLPPGTRYEAIPDDWQCPLCGLNKGELRLLPEAPAAAAPAKSVKSAAAKGVPRGGPEHVVIVGAGIAGWSVAEAIRARSPETPVLLVSACDGASYPKPALSTALAHGKRADDLVEQDAAGKAAQLGVDVRADTRVLKIDRAGKRLVTSKGAIHYSRLVLALGARQRTLAIAGDAAGTVLQVNDLAGYRKLRTRLEAGVRHVTVLGAGLIGCEFAEDLAAGGYAVSVVDPAAYPMANLLPASTGEALRRRLAQNGVQWRFGTTLERLESHAGTLRATLADGETLATDLVLSAAGLVANGQIAEKAGLAVGRGIETDRLMRTADPAIYAVGDCAAVDGQVFAYIEPIRRQAATIAAHLQGEERPFLPRPPLVRVKTPSFPLTVCPPAPDEQAAARACSEEGGRIDYLNAGRLVGFVLTGERAGSGMELYRRLHG